MCTNTLHGVGKLGLGGYVWTLEAFIMGPQIVSNPVYLYPLSHDSSMLVSPADVVSRSHVISYLGDNTAKQLSYAHCMSGCTRAK